MSSQEIALQLTLKAMETGYISKRIASVNPEHPVSAEEASQLTTQCVCDFYRAMLIEVNK